MSSAKTDHVQPAVLMLCWNYPPAVGGIESVAFHVCLGLREEGVRVRVLARHGAQDPDGDTGRPGAGGLVRYLLFSLVRGFKILRSDGTDLLLCPGIVDAPVAWLLSRLFRKPFVLLAHGSDIARKGFGQAIVTRFLFKQADGVAANSHNTRDLLVRAGCLPGRIRVIHPGVDDLAVEAPAPAGAWRGACPVIMTAGRVIKRKGILEFVECVMPALCHRYPDLTYVIAGGDATDSLVHHERLLEHVARRARELGLYERVRFTGKISDEDLASLYRAADLFVLPVIDTPGDVEGFGIVLLEAALHAVPAVSTRSGGVPDAVADGETGLLVTPGDWKKIEESIILLMDDHARRAEMGRTARSRAQKNFLWPVIARQYHTLILTVAHQREG